MGNWFKWGRSKTVAAASAVPIRHVCGCGETTDVLRGESLQRLTCASCGHVSALLPRDAYPGPGPVRPTSSLAAGAVRGASQSRAVAQPGQPGSVERSGASRARSVSKSRADSKVVRESGEAARSRARRAGVPVEQSAQRSSQPSHQDRSGDKDNRTQATPPGDGGASGARSPEPPLVTRSGIQADPVTARRRRLFTPFRLVAGCMLGLVIATGWWSVGQWQLSHDASRLGPLMRDGLASLEAGDFEAAARDLGIAAGVLDRNNEQGASADVIRQRSREATAASGLVTVSLVELLEEADRLQREGNGDRFQRQFDSDHRGGWLVMQSVLEVPGRIPSAGDGDENRGESASQPGDFEAEYPFVVGGRPVRLVGRLEALTRLPGWADPENDDPRPVIFAAQLDTCVFDQSAGVWRIGLATDTAFLWTDRSSIRRLGFVPDALLDEASLVEMLERQALAVGLQPEEGESDTNVTAAVARRGGAR